MSLTVKVAITILQVGLALAILPANYESQTALEKREVLWTQLQQKPYNFSALPLEGPSKLQAAQLLVPTFLTRSFSRHNDELDPADRPWKIIHTFGTCAKATLKAFSNSTYTGVFRSGAPGIIRLSAVRIDPTNLIPSMGFKVCMEFSNKISMCWLRFELIWLLKFLKA